MFKRLPTAPTHFAYVFSLPQDRESHSYFLALPLPVCLASVQISANGLCKRQGVRAGGRCTPPQRACLCWDTAQGPASSCLLRHLSERGWDTERSNSSGSLSHPIICPPVKPLPSAITYKPPKKEGINHPH